MKSILIVNTPKNCYECPCSNEGCYLCQISRRQLEDDFQDTRPSWCPLRPLPQKLEVKVDTFDDIMHTEFQMTDVIADKLIANIRFETDKLVALGYNACLDEILGETE